MDYLHHSAIENSDYWKYKSIKRYGFNSFLVMCNLTLLFCTTSLHAKYPLLIYYGSEYTIEHFRDYETVVLDPDLYEDVRSLKSRSFAYVSLGEVGTCRSYFEVLKKNGLLAGQNKNWGSYHIDISDGRWEQILIEEVIPPIIQSGYDGLFLDTVDSLLHRGESKEKIVSLIKAIKKRYPKLRLMLNRGFEIADAVPINALLYESTISGYDFKKNLFTVLPYDFRFNSKNKVERYSVDYWNPEETFKIKQIYKMALQKGYKPLVTEISLTKLPRVKWDAKKNILEYY